jgi:DNA-binding NarL/FixJ family response regulator
LAPRACWNVVRSLFLALMCRTGTAFTGRHFRMPSWGLNPSAPTYKQDHEMTYEILIADDHPLFRSALHQALSLGLGPDVRLVEAESIADLEARLTEKSDWDLVLLDLNMPGAYGFSGLVLLRGQYPQVPVVMVSAQEEAAVVVKSREFGASGFIPKSSSLETIQKAVRTVLDGDVWWPPQVNESVSVSAEAKAASAGLASLTPQQFRVLTMVCEGLLNKQIAYELSVSEATIKAHVTAIFRKLNVRTRTQAALLLQQLESIPSN